MSGRVKLFGIEIDALRMPEAVSRLLDWSAASETSCKYVVTPNVDHTLLLKEHPALRDAYRDASLVLADGMPVVLASRLLGRRLPERVTGADLVPSLFAAARAERPLKTYLLGAAAGVADRAAVKIEQQWPAVKIVGTYSPPLGFEKSDEENANILAKIAAAAPDVLVLGFGAPKQELWIHRFHKQVQAKTALCVGATIDFLAGEKPRAPQWMRSSGLEWLHRLGSEPRRLFRRYFRDAVVFPSLVWREWRASGAEAR